LGRQEVAEAIHLADRALTDWRRKTAADRALLLRNLLSTVIGGYSLLIQGTILIIIILISPHGLLGIFNRFKAFRIFLEVMNKPTRVSQRL
jgi:ABC-type branched-subunit amino acid transport system permease subunit